MGQQMDITGSCMSDSGSNWQRDGCLPTTLPVPCKRLCHLTHQQLMTNRFDNQCGTCYMLLPLSRCCAAPSAVLLEYIWRRSECKHLAGALSREALHGDYNDYRRSLHGRDSGAVMAST